ncbi:unnamed protein product [Dovyalis caffra]|uniref:F-box domain-containing protein n=1 Tax=Dovyalis caffra TaxID=77055 RepID=A0AAV1SHH3_9ROSI|nr:unnamed protein product [Dovyalis caffra]
MENCDLGISTKRIHEERATMEGLDRITSVLPDSIVHRILTFLPTKVAARTQILSKRRKALWLSFPFLNLHEIWFDHDDDNVETSCRVRFLCHMERTLRLCNLEQIKRLSFSTISPHDTALVSLLDTCLASVMKGKIIELDLNLQGTHNPKRGLCDHYILPQDIFSNGSHLVTIALEVCQFGSYDAMNFPSLRNFTMRDVHMHLVHSNFVFF